MPFEISSDYYPQYCSRNCSP